MYFSKLTLHPAATAKKEFWRDFRDEYSIHQALWRVFPEDADKDRDFLYRLDMEHGRPRIYMVSARAPKSNAPVWDVQTRSYAPKLKVGQRLGFSLRANPVVARDGKRHDVVMDAKRKLRQSGQPIPPQAVLAQEAGQIWLEARQERLGMCLESVLVEGHQVQNFRKKKGRSIRLATCDFQGVLRVQDPDCLRQVLEKGVGRARAFGCGLLLVRPLPE